MKMNNVLIVVRMLLLDKQLSSEKAKVLLRVVYIDDFSSTVWLCRIDDYSWPFWISRAELEAQMDPEHGRYDIEPDDPFDEYKVGKKNPKNEALHRHRYELIEPLVSGDNERLVLTKWSRKELVNQRLKEVKCSYDLIVNLLRLYWKRGMTYQALQPDFHKCGKIKDPEKKRDVKADVKLGAPRRDKTGGSGINIIGDYVNKAMQHGARFFLRGNKRFLKQAYDKMIKNFFRERTKDENGRTIYTINHDKKPTKKQLEYFIKKNYPYGVRRRNRQGQKNWDKKERPITGRADGDVQGPGDRFQIDATIADVYLVSSRDPNRIVGRPVIYFVKDVFSRLITSIYVGFEGPSWIGAMMALTNMVMDKVEFCCKYGIEIKPEEWPAMDAPRSIMGDRGELMSVDLGKNIIENLKIEIENASPGRPDLKALVERTFGTIPVKFRPYTPGYVEKDFNERGAEDYRLEASLNLYEFTQFVILAVLEHNEEPIKGLEISAEMVTEGLTACPLDLWEWGIQNRSGRLKRLTLDQVRLNVMPQATARVTARGIHFKKGYYSCETALRDEWWAKARQETWTVPVSYDPRDLGILYIHDSKFERGFEVCNLLPPSQDLAGVTLFEVEEVDIQKKRNEAEGEDRRQERRLARADRMEQITRDAKRRKKANSAPDMSKTEQTANIGSNKAEEKALQRESEKFDLRNSPDTGEKVPQQEGQQNQLNDDYLNKEIEMLDIKRKERETR